MLDLGPAPTDVQLDQFRNRIVALEESGCLAQDGASRVLGAVASSLALPSRQIFYARYGVFTRSPFVDLDSNFRLKTVSPLLAPGASELKIEAAIPDQRGPIDVKASPGLEGYETSYYELQPAPWGGVRAVLASVEQTRQGATTRAGKPAGFALSLPGDARRLRLVFMRAETGAIRDILLLAAASFPALSAATRRLEASGGNPEVCRNDREVLCLPVPRFSIITPELRVMVQGKAVYVGVGGTLGEALREAGVGNREEQRALAGRLQVLRPWHDKLIRVVPTSSPEALLGLVLIGGERITW